MAAAKSSALFNPYQGKNITLPECPGQVNFDCGHVQVRWACTFFCLSALKISRTTHTSAYCREIEKFGHVTFVMGQVILGGHLSIGQVCFKLCSCPAYIAVAAQWPPTLMAQKLDHLRIKTTYCSTESLKQMFQK